MSESSPSDLAAEVLDPPVVRPLKTAKKPNIVGVLNQAEERSFLENLHRFLGQSEEMDRAIEMIADLREREAKVATALQNAEKVVEAARDAHDVDYNLGICSCDIGHKCETRVALAHYDEGSTKSVSSRRS